MSKKIIINASNIHQGGGYTLLEALLNALDDDANFILLLDERMSVSPHFDGDKRVKRIRPSILDRIMAEMWLVKAVSPKDTVLCFGNQPPLFRLACRVIVFVQNRYLLEKVPLTGFRLRAKLRLSIERIWFKLRLHCVNEYVVQTLSMRGALKEMTKGEIPIRILPFVRDQVCSELSSESAPHVIKGAGRFIYVASGEPHKNHRRLVEAWNILAAENIFPTLQLTLDPYKHPELCSWITLMNNNHSLDIVNLGVKTAEEIAHLYRESDALIFPSNFESFGLPLIEAMQLGLPIIASESDYVRDILDPSQTFNPYSPVSIARAVKRFLGKEEYRPQLLDPARFLSSIFDGN